MRRITVIAGALVLAGAVAAPVAATPDAGAGHKVLVCHATSSSNPDHAWIPIIVDIAAANGDRVLANHYMHKVEPNKRDGRADEISEPFWDGEAVPTCPGEPG